TWAARLENNIEVRTIDDLLDRYLLEVVPTKAVSTHEQQRIWVRQLRRVFGNLPITGMRPRLVYRYVDARSKKKTTVLKNEDTGKDERKVTGGRVTAHREIE